MSKPKISIVIATFNRAHLIERALVRYEKQGFPLEDLELVYVEDWSQDWTDKLLRQWSNRLNIITVRPRYKDPKVWRSEASIINLGLQASKGELVILTHPEILIGNMTLVRMWEHRREGTYHCAKIYYLTTNDQNYLDNTDWEEDALAVRNVPHFYMEPSAEVSGHSDYTHEATDRHPIWESWVFGGFTRETWREFGGLTEFEAWGSVDVDFLGRRRACHYRNYTELDEDTICIHQNHDLPSLENPYFVPTNRNMDMALSNLPFYGSKENALKGPVW